MTPEPSKADWLYLFSSNQSPLYAQDILDVLAAPEGAHHTFRYDDRYVEEGTRADWTGLTGRPVIVLFSIQQKARYHDPAFIPVRRGEVVGEPEVVGTRHFVTFRLGGIVSLLDPEVTGGDAHEEHVRTFTQHVRDVCRAAPYGSSASLGGRLRTDPVVWQGQGNQEILFERTAEYLSLTDSFRDARFLRFLRLKPTGKKDARALKPAGEDPAFELVAGRTYDLQLLHAQRAELTVPEPYDVVADGTAVGVIGRAGFDIASRYDRLRVRIHAAATAGLEDRETLLAIRPGEGVQGPHINLRLRVKARKGRAVGVTVLQTAALLLVAAGSALTGLPNGVRVVFAIVGAFAAASLQLLAAQPLRPPSLPSLPAKPAAPAAPAAKAEPHGGRS